ncbi:MAG TPA: VWA domain-containing protein [Anditalea sp.]|nr:VWA domain-containing protein [Anditalea sp.]
MILRHTSLSKNIVQFCRFLRNNGYTLSAEDEATALQALQLIDYNERYIFKQALKSVLCRSLNELNNFDQLFIEYWTELDKAIDSKLKAEINSIIAPRTEDASFKSLKAWLNGNQNNETEETATYSIGENLSQKNFSTIPADELDDLMRSIKALSRRFYTQLNRRFTHSNKKNTPDLIRIVRKSMRHGGEFIELDFKKHKRSRTKLVLVCDVSKSMDLYVPFLLQFIFAFQRVFSKIETFAFSTSMEKISHLLKHHEFTTILNLLETRNNNWSGGTKIGESLNTLIKSHNQLFNKRTIVIIFSDGWDTGEIPLLQQSMEWIQRRSKKVIWLNPLAGYVSYRPEVAGMQAALPFVDVFAPVHNLDSLRKLGRWL